jgi:hypothetical protein
LVAGYGIGSSEIDLARRFYDSHLKIAHDSNVLRILDVFVILSQQTLRVGTIMFLRHMPHLVKVPAPGLMRSDADLVDPDILIKVGTLLA